MIIANVIAFQRLPLESKSLSNGTRYNFSPAHKQRANTFVAAIVQIGGLFFLALGFLEFAFMTIFKLLC